MRSVHVLLVAQACLEGFEGFRPKESRKNITFTRPDGTTYNGPVQQFYSMWSSAQIMSEMMDILMEEVLGLEAESPIKAWSSIIAVRAIAGCVIHEDTVQDPCELADGSADIWRPAAHISTEIWPGGLRAMDYLRDDVKPIEVGVHQYVGKEGLYISEEVARKTYESDRMILGHYRGWNASAFPREAFRHMRTLGELAAETDGVLAGATPVYEMRLFLDILAEAQMPTAERQGYRTSTGDSENGCYDPAADVLVDDSTCSVCETCKAWVSPKCRADPAQCVAVVSSAGWGTQEFGQWAAFFDWPIAIINARWGGYVATPKTEPVAFYWWAPDHNFASLAPVEVLMPEHNPDEHDQFVMRTGIPSAQLFKAIWQHLPGVPGGEHIEHILRFLTLSTPVLNEGMLSMAEGLPPDEIACTWLLQNEDTWRPWIPDLSRLRCNAGWYATDTMDRCEACDENTYQPSTSSSTCIPCPPGTFADEKAAIECQLCPPGFFIDPTGASGVCELCMVGTYRDPMDSTTDCSVCPGSFTTLAPGASRKALCTCGEGTWWNRKQDSCDKCPAGAFCPGGLELPVVYEGFYGKLLAKVDDSRLFEADELAKAAKLVAVYDPTQTLGDTNIKGTDLVFKVEVYECSSDQACPADSSIKAFDMMTDYSAPDVVMSGTRRAFPLKGSCPDQRVGVACGRCDTGLYGKTECHECGSGGAASAVILLLVMPIVVMCGYRGMRGGGSNRVQSAFVLVSTVGMAAFFMQTIAVMGAFAFEWPAEIDWLLDLSRIFLLDVGGFSFSCVSGDSFAGKYSFTIILPLVIIFMTGLSAIITRVAPVGPDWKMEFDPVFCMLGMIFTALYITLVKIVVTYFECRPNPAADSTLQKFRDVVCDSDEHTAGLPAMAIGMVVYMIGFYCLFLHATYSAVANWANPSFRERWKFMFQRWRPDTYYWGCVVITRNLLVAMVGIMSSEPRIQLLVVVVFVLFVVCATASYHPWRAEMLNAYDIVSSYVLALVGIFGLIFLSLRIEETLNQRFGELDAAAKNTDEMSTFGTALAVLIVIFFVLFMLICGWCFALFIPSYRDASTAKSNATKAAFVELIMNVTKGESLQEKVEGLVVELTPYDQRGAESFLLLLQAADTSSRTADTVKMDMRKGGSGTGGQTVSA